MVSADRLTSTPCEGPHSKHGYVMSPCTHCEPNFTISFHKTIDSSSLRYPLFTSQNHLFHIVLSKHCTKKTILVCLCKLMLLRCKYHTICHHCRLCLDLFIVEMLSQYTQSGCIFSLFATYKVFFCI